MNRLKLKVITPNGVYVDGIEIDNINVQTSAGDMTIYARHASIVSTLKVGQIKYVNEQGVKYVHVHRGILKVSHNEVKILTQWLYEVDENGKKTGPRR
ncbi:F0F1 ATP synthase subunit epsilon [Spiroplasma chinense]|uniref:F0F1 ATP synthase subunit epsilon n=1 Tax=Spiroplasma chinense TaxID=216932 RepID=A0A5B9Y2L8_9MOLU|nr:F0F1 ATP synthase subunit epsilon [Spiroplasma chinense]QEH61278.1 F0F1 ATP synthase subunit epsilon [Spiroplasma chinense]